MVALPLKIRTIPPMRNLTASLALAATLTLTLTGCVGGNTPGGDSPEQGAATSAPTLGAALSAEQLAAEAETLRTQLEDAYNAVAVEPQPTLEEYDSIYNPIWRQALEKGITLTRRPYPKTDGFVLNQYQAVTPGHSLLTAVTSGNQSFCIASTDTLDPATLTEEQVAASLVNPREFVILDGDCEDIVDYLKEVLPIEISPELRNEIEGTSTVTLSPDAP